MTDEQARELAGFLDAFDAAGRRIADQERERHAIRDAGIRHVHALGLRQSEIVRITGYSRETVRQILNPEARDAAKERLAKRRKAAKSD